MIALRVKISEQRMYEYRFPVFRSPFRVSICGATPVAKYLISTSRFGVGEEAGSNKTPRGWHKIARKIGGGYPQGTVFKGRVPVGSVLYGMSDAKIAHRILWLEGLEEGKNKGGNVDTFQRYVYIHGVGDELTLGRPASCGCIHLAARDLMPLYERVHVGDLVWIEE